jgi:glycosyltransferase involved in cell wall biosynthesis
LQTPNPQQQLKVSIVTAVYNRERTLQHALNSVEQQTYPVIEHVLIDGGSRDGTMDLIRKAKLRSPIIVSERDEGIYDALNKGLRMATGDVIGLLHSDDAFADERVVAEVAACFADPIVNLVYGDLDYVDSAEGLRVVRHWHSGRPSASAINAGWMPPHPTVFVRSSLYAAMGGFRKELRIAADYDLMLRLFLSGKIEYRYIPRVLVKMRTGGESNRSVERIVTKSREDFQALRWNGFSTIGAVRALVLKNLRKVGQLWVRA